MDLLRWILLGLGLLLIAAIWFDDRRNRPAHRESLLQIARRRWRRETTGRAAAKRAPEPEEVDLPDREEPDFGFDPAELDELFDRGRESTEAPLGGRQAAPAADTAPEQPPDDDPAGGTTGAEPPPRATPAAGDPAAAEPMAAEQPSAEQPSAEQPATEPARRSRSTARTDRGTGDGEAGSTPPETGEERIVVLYVVAPKGERLHGDDLYRAFTELGLEYGDLDIFHALDESGRRIFSVANATEPGTFDPATMAGMTTPGVALFARLPGAQSPTRTFDAMAAAARQLAQALDGRALDERQSTLTRQTQQAMRDELLDYEHRQARNRR